MSHSPNEGPHPADRTSGVTTSPARPSRPPVLGGTPSTADRTTGATPEPATPAPPRPTRRGTTGAARRPDTADPTNAVQTDQQTDSNHLPATRTPNTQNPTGVAPRTGVEEPTNAARAAKRTGSSPPRRPARRDDSGRLAAGRSTAAQAADSAPRVHAASAGVPGVLLAAAVAVPATVVGEFLPLVGGPVAGLVGGAAAGAVLRRRDPGAYARYRPGLDAAGRHVLQIAVVVLGLCLPLGRVADAGLRSLPVLLATLAVALVGAWGLGRLLRLHPDTRILIGAGTGICGASAIAAVASVIRPTTERTAYALGTIFTFNLVAVAVYPALGRLLGLSDPAFGLWAGTAINDTSSVIAAASAFGAGAVTLAVVVKLGRSLMIVPVCVALHLWRARGGGDGRGTGRRSATAALVRAFPPFVLCFLLTSALAAAGAPPAGWRPAVTELSAALITVALAGIGAGLDPRAVRTAGPRPLVFGGALGAAVGASALAVQLLTGQV